MLSFRTRGRPSARGFTLIELIIVCAILGIVAAIVVHYVLKAKMAGNEASAIGTLRALNAAQTAYASSCGRNGYAPTFTRLADGGYASPDLDLNPKGGYVFTMTAGAGAAGAPDCETEQTNTAYYASAAPQSPANGTRAFATSTVGTIWQNMAGVPPEEPFAMTGSIHPIQ